MNCRPRPGANAPQHKAVPLSRRRLRTFEGTRSHLACTPDTYTRGINETKLDRGCLAGGPRGDNFVPCPPISNGQVTRGDRGDNFGPCPPIYMGSVTGSFIVPGSGLPSCCRHEGVSLPTTTRWPGVWEEKKGFVSRWPATAASAHKRPHRGGPRAPSSRRAPSRLEHEHQTALQEARPGGFNPARPRGSLFVRKGRKEGRRAYLTASDKPREKLAALLLRPLGPIIGLLLAGRVPS